MGDRSSVLESAGSRSRSRSRLFSSTSVTSELSVDPAFQNESFLIPDSLIENDQGPKDLSEGKQHIWQPKIETNVDFKELSKQMGYVKARTYIRKLQIKDRLKIVKKQEDDQISMREEFRLAEMIKLSNALGEPGLEQPIDKIIASASRKLPRAPGITDEEYAHAFDNDIAIRRAILSQDLSIPQVHASLSQGIKHALCAKTCIC